MEELCNMINFIAAGERILLLSSGFNVSKEYSSTIVLEPAKNVVIEYGLNSGEMKVSVKGAKGHKGLVFEYSLAADNNQPTNEVRWISKLSTTTKCTIANMPVGQRVYIRIGISGSHKQFIYTAPVLKMVA